MWHDIIFFSMGAPTFQHPFVEKTFMFQINWLGTFVKNGLTICGWLSFWTHCPSSLLSVSTQLFIANCLVWRSFILSLGIDSIIRLLTLCSCFKIDLAILYCLHFLTDFRINFSPKIFTENVVWDCAEFMYQREDK